MNEEELENIKQDFMDGKITIKEVYKLLKGIEIISSINKDYFGKVVGSDEISLIVSNSDGWIRGDHNIIDPDNVGGYWYVDIKTMSLLNKQI